LTTIVIAAHEIPQGLSNILVLLNGGLSKQRALWFTLIASATALLGGLVSYALLWHVATSLPILLALSASCLIYIALSDIIPQLHESRSSRESWQQLAGLMCGVMVILMLTRYLHQH
jgi:zinc and cadmium transporter